MKPGAKAFGMIGIIVCVVCSLVVLWGCGGGVKEATGADEAAAGTMAGAEMGADGPTQTEIAAVVETDTRKAEKTAGQGESAGGSFTDPRDNQTYRTTRIGDQTWMAENLNHQTENSWCYDDDPSNCDKYGRLYTLKAAKSACSGLGGGWRLPSNEDWDDLTAAVGGGAFVSVQGDVGYWENVGTKLKSTSGWYNNGNGTDDYGFSALPGGLRSSDGGFDDAGGYGNWWSATEDDAVDAWYRGMNYSNGIVGRLRWRKTRALSARCLRD